MTTSGTPANGQPEAGERKAWYVYLQVRGTGRREIAVTTATSLQDATERAYDLWSEHYHITGLTDDMPYELTWAAQHTPRR